MIASAARCRTGSRWRSISSVNISATAASGSNATLLETTLRRELTYHAVTDRYVLRDDAGVEQESFPTLEAAIDQVSAASRICRSWSKSQLQR